IDWTERRGSSADRPPSDYRVRDESRNGTGRRRHGIATTIAGNRFGPRMRAGSDELRRPDGDLRRGLTTYGLISVCDDHDIVPPLPSGTLQHTCNFPFLRPSQTFRP